MHAEVEVEVAGMTIVPSILARQTRGKRGKRDKRDKRGKRGKPFSVNFGSRHATRDLEIFSERLLSF